MSNPNVKNIVLKYLSSGDFSDFVESLYEQSYSDDNAEAKQEVVDYFTNLEDFGGNLETDPDASKFTSFKEFADGFGSCRPTFRFDANEENMLVNEALDLSDKEIRAPRNWNWDDPGTLYAFQVPETLDEVKSLISEAQDIHSLANEIYDELASKITVSQVEAIIDQVDADEAAKELGRQIRADHESSNIYQAEKTVSEIIDLDSYMGKIGILQSASGSDLFLCANSLVGGSHEDLADCMIKILAHGGFGAGPVPPDFWTREWTILVKPVDGKLPRTDIERQKILDVLDGRIGYEGFGSYVKSLT